MKILTAYLSRLFPRLTPSGPASGNMSDDLRREYVMRLIASDCPVGDCGAQGLMAMFPRDF